MKEHTIDASGKSVGRIATEAAVLLMGKDTPAFRKNIAPDVKVTITNAASAKIDAKKLKTKIYQRYSGFPGGRKERTMEEVIDVKGYAEIFEKAVYGMLPANKLRSVLMKNLTISE
jgi:large subunit ribosomal protein L13